MTGQEDLNKPGAQPGRWMKTYAGTFMVIGRKVAIQSLLSIRLSGIPSQRHQ